MTRAIAVACVAVMLGCANGTVTSPTETVIDVNSFTSLVTPGGGASRQFELSARAVVSARLSSTTPGGISLGVGLGIPRANGSCAVANAVVTEPGAAAQVSAEIEAGPACVRVYDPGGLAEPVAFTVVMSR